MNTIKFLVIALLFITSTSANAQQNNVKIVVDKTSQVLLVVNKTTGEALFSAPCGTGTELEDGLVTPAKTYKITDKYGIEAVSNNEDTKGVPMPYKLRLNGSTICIHGSPYFVVLKGKGNEFGLPQSHGCIRLSVENAKRVHSMVNVGTEVQVIGSIKDFLLGRQGIMTDLYSPGPNNTYVLKAKVSPTAENIEKLRKAFFDGQILVKGKKGSHDCVVGYPFMPPNSRIPLGEFEKIILTEQELAAGRRLIRTE